MGKKDKSYITVTQLADEMSEWYHKLKYDKDTPEADRLDTLQRRLREITKVVKDFTGNKEREFKIPLEQKAQFIMFYKEILGNKNIMTIFNRQFKYNKKITDEEGQLLIKLFTESFSIGLSEEESKVFFDNIEASSHEEYFKMRDIVEQIVTDDMDLLMDIEAYDVKKSYMVEYAECLKKSLKKWRDEVELCRGLEEFVKEKYNKT